MTINDKHSNSTAESTTPYSANAQGTLTQKTVSQRTHKRQALTP